MGQARLINLVTRSDNFSTYRSVRGPSSDGSERGGRSPNETARDARWRRRLHLGHRSGRPGAVQDLRPSAPPSGAWDWDLVGLEELLPQLSQFFGVKYYVLGMRWHDLGFRF